jgi:hypothetical protein
MGCKEVQQMVLVRRNWLLVHPICFRMRSLICFSVFPLATRKNGHFLWLAEIVAKIRDLVLMKSSFRSFLHLKNTKSIAYDVATAFPSSFCCRRERRVSSNQFVFIVSARIG